MHIRMKYVKTTAITLTAITMFSFSPAFADVATTTPEAASSTPAVATTTPDTITLTIRDGSVTAFSGTVELAATSAPDVLVTPTAGGDPVAVSSRSLLATLLALDTVTDTFEVTKLTYYPSRSSFLIDCITVPASDGSPHCFNWTYAVNGSYPFDGVDDKIMSNGDSAHFFFGPSRQAIVSTTTVAAGEPFTATAQNYDLTSGTYVPAPGYTLGVGTPNPDWSFTELATGTADANGKHVFTVNATGTYAVGIQEDFYFPTVSITITDTPATSTATSTPAEPVPVQNSGGGGSSGSSAPVFNVPLALNYLSSLQKTDGSFADPMLTDWVAVAFGAADPGSAKQLLRTYLTTAAPALSSITDYERHAMALLALGIDPYTGTSVNYISPITSAFDGTQIGDAGLINDDVFAIFPLMHAGYSAGDDIIQKTLTNIVSKQKPNGSWENSVDMTAAAVQALSLAPSFPGVADALAAAKAYVHAQQQSDGGFSNTSSTSWALQAIAALGESLSGWMSGSSDPKTYLGANQQSDGGVEPLSANANTRVWATAYTIPGYLMRTWDSLLSSVPKPAAQTPAGGTVLGTATSTAPVATSTPLAATSTPSIATTTLPIATTTPVAMPPITLVRDGAATTSPRVRTVTPPSKNIIPAPHVAVDAGTISTTTTSPAQTAAVGAASGGFLSRLWSSIVSFLVRLF